MHAVLAKIMRHFFFPIVRLMCSKTYIIQGYHNVKTMYSLIILCFVAARYCCQQRYRPVTHQAGYHACCIGGIAPAAPVVAVGPHLIVFLSALLYLFTSFLRLFLCISHDSSYLAPVSYC